jgi:hypothetical protein
MMGTPTTVTDENGRYRFGAVPPGTGDDMLQFGGIKIFVDGDWQRWAR